MKLDNPEWETSSPGAMPDGIVYSFMDWARSIASQARVKQDVYEDFKSYFAGKNYVRSSTEHDAEWDLRKLMDEAAQNVPIFLARFAEACADFKKMGYRVPSTSEINRALWYGVGFSIDGDRVVQSRWMNQENAPVFNIPPEPPRPVVEFVAMKLGDPGWAFDSPGLIPRQILDETKALIGQVAVRASNPKDVYETFKSHFAAARGESSTYGSSSTSWAETDMEREMDDAAGNAPLFIVAFADGCAQLREEGIGVPSVDRINKLLDQFDAGYQIKGDTIVATSQRVKSPRQQQENPPAPVPSRLSGGFSKSQPVQAKAKSLQVFLCHSKADKPAVKDLHKKLKTDGYNPWLDAVNLFGGQDWDFEIRKAVRASEIVLVCLSNQSVNRAGFMQKEIKLALDVADEQPEGRIYIIPVRLEDCEVPARLSKFHWVDLFEEDGYDKVIESLKLRAAEISAT
jgi:hypothetical protein